MKTNLLVCGLTDVQQLALEWKDAIVVPANDPQTGDCQRLGWVSLGQDERTLLRVLRACIVGIIQLGNALQLGVLGWVALLVQLRLGLELHPAQHALHNATLVHLPEPHTVKTFITSGRLYATDIIPTAHIPLILLKRWRGKKGGGFDRGGVETDPDTRFLSVFWTGGLFPYCVCHILPAKRWNITGLGETELCSQS